jgi:hypothetical protein
MSPFLPFSSMVLGARRHVPCHGQVGQKLLDFQAPHGVGMFDSMKADVALRPVGIASLRPNGEMLHPSELTKLIEQFHDSPVVGNFRPNPVLYRRRGLSPANSAGSA